MKKCTKIICAFMSKFKRIYANIVELTDRSINQDMYVKGLNVLVAYLLIIFFTVLFLTYITYKLTSFFSYHLPLKTLFLYAFFACILGLLVPRLIAMSNISMWLIALMSLLVLSSYVLSRSTDIMVEDTAETNSMSSFQHEIPEDEKPVQADSFLIASSATDDSGNNNIIGPVIPLSAVCTISQEMDESANVVIPEQITEETPLVVEDIKNYEEEALPEIAHIDQVTLPVETESEELSLAAVSDPDVSDEQSMPEEISPIINAIAEMVEETLPEIADINQVALPAETEPEELSPATVSDTYVSNEGAIHREILPVIDGIEDMEEETPAMVEVSYITPCVDIDELYTAEDGDREEGIYYNDDGVHDIAYYLDLGFAAKESGDYRKAARAFQKAIDIEPDNPSVLYIIIEICALLKIQGFYDDAISQMQKGRDLAFAFNDERMAGEFIDGITYLQTLLNDRMQIKGGTS